MKLNTHKLRRRLLLCPGCVSDRAPISLLGFCPLDDLPSRILRFRQRIVRFKCSIIHVPGKQLVTADSLSRASLGPENSTECDSLEKECEVYIDHLMEQLHATKTKLEHIKDLQNGDGTMRQLRVYTDRGWLVHRKAVPELLIPYWPHRADIHMADGILLKGEWIVIPAPMCREMLDKIHHGHQGMTKRRQSTTIHMVARIIHRHQGAGEKVWHMLQILYVPDRATTHNTFKCKTMAEVSCRHLSVGERTLHSNDWLFLKVANYSGEIESHLCQIQHVWGISDGQWASSPHLSFQHSRLWLQTCH